MTKPTKLKICKYCKKEVMRSEMSRRYGPLSCEDCNQMVKRVMDQMDKQEPERYGDWLMGYTLSIKNRV